MLAIHFLWLFHHKSKIKSLINETQLEQKYDEKEKTEDSMENYK